MDLDELRAFLALADSGSFLAAADTLSLSRTTLRRRVEALEARVGVPLLYRGAQGATLTEAGRLLAERGRPLVREANAVLTSVRDAGAEPGGVLRVVLPVGLPPHAMVPLFVALRAAYARLSVEARFYDDPLSGPLDDLDLALHLGPRIPDGPWITRVLLRLRVHLVGSVDYLAARGTPRTVEDLKGHELLAWRPPGGDPRLWPALQGPPIVVEPTLVSADIHTLRQLALAGHGLALVPDALLPDPGVPDGHLVPVLTDVIGEDCPLRVVVPEAMAQAPKIKALLSRIEAFLEPG